ncbi:hypothetical protein SPRG_10299 [Saprolegnia parasitica CBS 223.65]|uniref:Uncharacterized protein n=1 Tax=Saprolegnia parasitica (strain CBS 223.65) TaxID=695850 RepID=A0A067C1R4_SAPPC|nr:hypothetical protein SPRG_10299 [Saprolegnia parasitica CBS 223.65]KDO24483.1 hypothetical protein SPRG_10299 [Saprolegnia parasitica CBS 223.65]|eukprot:XP_012204749.1 hypothetical protein SPRG_10299 [Saprolegnia parasitica CBS 223.65]
MMGQRCTTLRRGVRIPVAPCPVAHAAICALSAAPLQPVHHRLAGAGPLAVGPTP